MIEKVSVAQLQQRSNKVTAQVEVNKKRIDAAISGFNKGVRVSSSLDQRFEDFFDTPRTRKVFRRAIIIFMLCILFLYFFQPAFFVSVQGKTVIIRNKSSTLAEKVFLINAFTFEKTNILDNIAPKGEAKLLLKERGVYFVIAQRKLPAIVFFDPGV